MSNNDNNPPNPLNLTPSQDQLMGQLRLLIMAIGTAATTVGASSTTTNYWVNVALTLTGPAIIIGSIIWSLFVNSRASIMKAASKPKDANTPEPQIVLPIQEKALADKLPDNVTAIPLEKAA
jgi:hypothetical protein